MARLVVVMLCAGLLAGACGPEAPKKTLHLPLATPNRAGPRHVCAYAGTLWSIRGDGSGRIPLGYIDSTGNFVVICPYVRTRGTIRSVP